MVLLLRDQLQMYGRSHRSDVDCCVTRIMCAMNEGFTALSAWRSGALYVCTCTCGAGVGGAGLVSDGRRRGASRRLLNTRDSQKRSSQQSSSQQHKTHAALLPPSSPFFPHHPPHTVTAPAKHSPGRERERKYVSSSQRRSRPQGPQLVPDRELVPWWERRRP